MENIQKPFVISVILGAAACAKSVQSLALSGFTSETIDLDIIFADAGHWVTRLEKLFFTECEISFRPGI